MFNKKQYLVVALILLMTLLVLSCAPGNERWNQEINPGHKAGFWAGIWHGLIIIITFIVSLFTKEVGLYEVNNAGWGYNLGFIIGLLFSVGGGLRSTARKKKHKKIEWKEVGDKIEEKVREGVKAWLDEPAQEEKKKEWEEIGKKIEEKIKKALKEWADKQEKTC